MNDHLNDSVFVVSTLEEGENETITSKNYPSNYSNNYFQMWDFQAPEGFVFSIDIQKLEIADDDALYVGDAAEYFYKDNQSCSLWYTINNRSSNSNIVSKSSSILVIFSSSDSNSDKGFSILLEITSWNNSNIYENGE